MVLYFGGKNVLLDREKRANTGKSSALIAGHFPSDNVMGTGVYESESQCKVELPKAQGSYTGVFYAQAAQGKGVTLFDCCSNLIMACSESIPGRLLSEGISNKSSGPDTVWRAL